MPPVTKSLPDVMTHASFPLLTLRLFGKLCLPMSPIDTLSKACATETQCQIYRGLLPAVANLSDFPQSPPCETKVSCHPGDQRRRAIVIATGDIRILDMEWKSSDIRFGDLMIRRILIVVIDLIRHV